MSKEVWKDIDAEDIPGYLVDYIERWLEKHSISSINDFNESFQSDGFGEDVDELAEEVVTAVLGMRS